MVRLTFPQHQLHRPKILGKTAEKSPANQIAVPDVSMLLTPLSRFPQRKTSSLVRPRCGNSLLGKLSAATRAITEPKNRTGTGRKEDSKTPKASAFCARASSYWTWGWPGRVTKGGAEAELVPTNVQKAR
jgi:hypothetical protein